MPLLSSFLVAIFQSQLIPFGSNVTGIKENCKPLTQNVNFLYTKRIKFKNFFQSKDLHVKQ